MKYEDSKDGWKINFTNLNYFEQYWLHYYIFLRLYECEI